MHLIVPMAGRGTRLRPHTHVTPKPLLPVLGRSMVERIVETFVGAMPQGFTDAVFVLGPDFGEGVRDDLRAICSRHGIEPHFAVQEAPRGTAHAVAQAGEWLAGECVLVFADTLFEMGTPDLDADAVVWTKWVDDPSRFGVAVKDGERITQFVEKPDTPISNEAIVGIYYVRDGAALQREIQHLIDYNVTGKGDEYQLTDALDRMLQAGLTFKTASVDAWLDCGTIPALQDTSRQLLDAPGEARTEGRVENSTVIEPSYIGPDAHVVDSVVGPYAAIHGRARVRGAALRDTIVFEDATVEDSSLHGSVVGHHAEVRGFAGTLNVGDHATVGEGA